MSSFQIPKSVQTFGKDIQQHELRYHRKRVAVSKEFSFDAAHHLHCYEGKCKSLHGHTYILRVTVSGYVNDIGIVVDFGDVKEIYEQRIKNELDHQYLNDVLPNMNTTAENMIVWMWEQYEDELQQRGLHEEGCRLEEMVLYETPTSYAQLKREWMLEDE